MSNVKWGRANDGFVSSKDGRWRITPLYCGCVNPQFYELWFNDKLVSGSNSTQREAKEEAERYLASCPPPP
jgi:hypothetical protein